MSTVINWKWKRIEILRIISKTPLIFVFYALLILLFCSILFFFYTDKEHDNNLSDFLYINQEVFGSYNPYYLDKYYLPIPDKIGFILDLSEIEHDAYFEIVINPYNRYDIEFLKDDEIVGNIEISEVRTVKSVPETAVKAGYNYIKVIPVRGKNFAIGYFQTLNDFEENVILQEYDEQHFEAVILSDNVGSPFDITGIIAYIENYNVGILEIGVTNIGALSSLSF